MLDRRHLVALVEHDVGLREGGIGIAEAQLLVIVFVVVLERVLRIGAVDRHRAGLERFLDVEHRRQRLVGDANLRQRFERRPLAGGDDGEHRLALVAHDVGRERRLVVLAELDEAQKRVEIDRHIGRANDPLDPRRARRDGIVDRADARVGVRAAQHLQMQEIAEAVVVVIGRGAGDVPEHVLALCRLADFLEIVVAFVGEDVFAQFEHGLVLQARRRLSPRAASSTAAMIGS